MLILQEYYIVNDDNHSSINGTSWSYQEFTPGLLGSGTFSLGAVALHGFTTEASGDVVIEIRAIDANHKPTGATLATATAAKNLWPVGALPDPATVSVPFASHITLTTGVKYAICVHVTSGLFAWRHDSSGATYTGGVAGTSADNGVTWTARSFRDMRFLVYSYSEDAVVFTGTGTLEVSVDFGGILIPYRPEAPLTEVYEFKTSIHANEDGSEQRMALRKIPRRSWIIKIAAGSQEIESLLFGKQAESLYFPAWHDPAFLSATVGIGDVAIPVSATEFREFENNLRVVLIKDERNYHLATVASFDATTVNIVPGVTQEFFAKMQVIPVKRVFVDGPVSVGRDLVNRKVFSMTLLSLDDTQDIVEYVAIPGTGTLIPIGWNYYDDKIILDDPCWVDGSITESRTHNVHRIDGNTGLINQFSGWDTNKRGSVKGFVTHTRQELWRIRQLLYYLQGRCVSFYAPTFDKDLIPNAALSSASDNLYIENANYTRDVDCRDPRVHIRVVLTDGSVIERNITNAQEVSAEQELLTVDAVWGQDVALVSIDRIEFFELVRIDTDEIKIVHQNALGCAQITFPIVGVKE